MKNSVTCPNCKIENPFYNYICSNCSSYLRDRIYNLDLWKQISLLIESPPKSFRTIILAEHKNFIFFLLILLCLKYLINARFISMLSLGEFQSTVGLQFSYLIVLGGTILFFLLFTVLYNFTGQMNDIYLRFKDTFTLIVYSQVPFVFGLVVLFILEIVIFGDYLFSLNPNPFVIKGIIAYLFLSLEIGLIIWSIFLVYKAFLAQSQHFLFSMTSTITFSLLLSGLIYSFSLFVFTV